MRRNYGVKLNLSQQKFSRKKQLKIGKQQRSELSTMEQCTSILVFIMEYKKINTISSNRPIELYNEANSASDKYKVWLFDIAHRSSS